MKAKDFTELLKSLDEARAIREGKRKASRVIAFNRLGPAAEGGTWEADLFSWRAAARGA